MTETTMPPPEHVKWYVVETDDGYRPHRDILCDKLETPNAVYGPTTFKAAYREFYRLRAEKAGVADYCHRCGNSEGSHNSYCPDGTGTAPLPPRDAAKEAEVNSDLDVILKEVGGKKIPVIRVVRTLMGVNLKEAKTIVDMAPVSLKKMAKDAAEQARAQLEEAGAVVELK